jgi:phage shock protein PspC (stress-responsive transcriptional regulator)
MFAHRHRTAYGDDPGHSHRLLRELSGPSPMDSQPCNRDAERMTEGTEGGRGIEQAPSSLPRRLERRREQRLLGGVAGGLADHFGIDAAWFRIAFLVLALFGGGGLFLYALGWLLIPERGAPESAASALTRDVGVRKVGAIALIGIGLLVLASPTWVPLVEAGFLDSSLGWAFVLVVIGFALLRGERPGPRHESETLAGVPAETLAVSATQSSASAPPGPAPETWRPPFPPTPLKPRPRRSPLGWIAVALALLAVGVGALLDRSTSVSVDAGGMMALVLIILGLGLVVGTFWGRARWLVFVGVVVLPVALATNLIDFPLRGQVGGNYLAPLRASDLNDDYRVLAGSLTFDMTNFDFNARESTSLPLHMAIANVNISVPRGVRVELRGHLEAGQVSFFGARREGVDLRFDEVAGGPELERELVVDLDAQYGSVNVYRSGLVRDLRSEQRAAQQKEAPPTKPQTTDDRSRAGEN